MGFGKRLTGMRKARGFTQQSLADTAGIHVVQVRRYETGVSQPSLEILRKLAVALSVRADELLFDEYDRGPTDDFRLEFEAVARLDKDEQQLVRYFIEGMLLKHEAKRWINRDNVA
ncbi:MAG: helix-turn-helix domain-containing protein [Thermoanaerobaculales bacterium]